MPEWLQQWVPSGWTMTHVMWASVALFLISLIGSLLFAAYILVRLPADYFLPDSPRTPKEPRSAWIRWPLAVLKNLFGLFLILLGIVLSLPGVPGQGALTILIGVMFLDVPIFRRLERWLISRRSVRNTINKLRARYGRDPLRFEEEQLSNPPEVAK